MPVCNSPTCDCRKIFRMPRAQKPQCEREAALKHARERFMTLVRRVDPDAELVPPPENEKWHMLRTAGKAALVRICESEVHYRVGARPWQWIPFPKRTRGLLLIRDLLHRIVNIETIEEEARRRREESAQSYAEREAKRRAAEQELQQKLDAIQESFNRLVREEDLAGVVQFTTDSFGASSLRIDASMDLESARRILQAIKSVPRMRPRLWLHTASLKSAPSKKI